MLAVLLLTAAASVFAEGSAPLAAYPGDDAKTHLNYQLYCQGCHSPTGAGSGSVPKLDGHVGTFLRSEEGRRFLIRVPGAATSVLNDDELARVLNWMVMEFGGESIPPEFEPYTPEEVASIRHAPLTEISAYRAGILAAIAGSE
jgi:mono/diheme cytochrome c family protein